MKKIKYDRDWHFFNRFQLLADWRRVDSLDVCVTKTSGFLNDFIKLCPEWLPFKVYSTRRRSATSCYYTVPPFDELKEIIVEGLDKYTTHGGSTVYYDSAIKPTNYKKLILIKLDCGAHNGAFNQSYMHFPPQNEEVANIISEGFLKNCYDLFLKHWQPRHGFIIPSYSLIWEYTKKEFDSVGWLTYFSDGLGELPKFPDWVKIIPADGYGTYIQISEKLPDYKNEKEFNEIVDKMIELSKIISPWIMTKRDLMI
jgi:hypothetical protein